MKSFDEFRAFWRRIEKKVIYILLFVFIVAQWSAVFIPSISTILSTHVNTALFSMLLLAVFRLFDYRIVKPSIDSHGGRFSEALDAVMATEGAIESLDLFAHTSSKYFNAIRNKKVHIKRLRLLILSDECILKAPSPHSQENKKSVVDERRVIIKKWQEMQEEGHIKEMSIHEYVFTPYFHFAIINKNAAIFGLFRPLSASTGVTTLSLQSMHDHSLPGAELIHDFILFFDTVYKDFSKEINSGLK